MSKNAGTPCPYGRKTRIGETQCVNCKFYHIRDNSCSGDLESVQAHMLWLRRTMGIKY